VAGPVAFHKCSIDNHASFDPPNISRTTKGNSRFSLLFECDHFESVSLLPKTVLRRRK
jgi:hypothetical protein